jgi:hypothetical protein
VNACHDPDAMVAPSGDSVQGHELRRIADSYASAAAGDLDIYSILATGLDKVRVTSNPADDDDPAW